MQTEWREISSGTVDMKPASTSAGASIVGRFTSWLRQMFLPTNYPQSVHVSYLPYHILQFLEGIVGTVVGVLCNQALLVSVGISAEGSILGAVAVQWIIKDGAGEIAKLWFIRRYSPFFDSHPKTFNLIGSGFVLLGSGLQIAALLIPPTLENFLLCAAGGNVFKMVGGAIWLTCHIKFIRLFSKQGNMGDVAAKAESQGSVSQLLGYGVGVGLLAVSQSPAYLYSVFAVAAPLHLVTIAYMLRVATFELLTLPRLTFLAKDYAAGAGRPESEEERNLLFSLPSLAELERREEIGFYGEFFKHKEDNYLELAPKLEDIIASPTPATRETWDACVEAFNNNPYLLYPHMAADGTCKIAAFYRPSITTDNILRSALHAAFLERHIARVQASKDGPLEALGSREVLDPVLAKSQEWTTLHYLEFKNMLTDSGWQTDEIAFADRGRRVLWGSATHTQPPPPAPLSASSIEK